MLFHAAFVHESDHKLEGGMEWVNFPHNTIRRTTVLNIQ